MKKDTLTKREREKEIVSHMIALYCKKKHENKNILLQLQGTLLSACHERKNQGSYEVFRTEDDIHTSDHCHKTCD